MSTVMTQMKCCTPELNFCLMLLTHTPVKHKGVKTSAKLSWLTNEILEAIKNRDSLKKQLERGKNPRNTRLEQRSYTW